MSMVIDAIMKKAIKRKNGCWEWQGATVNKYGHGVTNVACQQVLVHRIILELSLGRGLDKDECACHHCDNPPCINPDHLFAGSQADNIMDSCLKGRSGHKINSAIAVEIFNALGKYADIGREYGVSHVTVHNIKTGKAWGHATGL